MGVNKTDEVPSLHPSRQGGEILVCGVGISISKSCLWEVG